MTLWRPRKSRMQSDPLISELADEMSNEAGSDRQGCYIEPASTIDVMFEQLEYLLAHESEECPAGCRDCTRLQEIEGWLLQPFRAAGIRQTGTSLAA
jgi:hypothetical protein